jgi:hypothetical protein
VGEDGQQWRTLEDFQQRLRQLLEDFPEDSHSEVHGVLGLVTAMALQVRVPCDHCGKLTPAVDGEPGTGQVVDFAAAQRRRQRAEVPDGAPVHPLR